MKPTFDQVQAELDQAKELFPDKPSRNTALISEGICPSVTCGAHLDQESPFIIFFHDASAWPVRPDEHALMVPISPCSACNWYYGLKRLVEGPFVIAVPKSWLVLNDLLAPE